MKSTYKKLKHTVNGVFAIKSEDKALIVGNCTKDSLYVIADGQEVVSAPTIERLKTILTKSGLEFNEIPVRPISQ